MTETLPLPEETASTDEHDGQDTIPAGNSTESAEETGNPSEVLSSGGAVSRPAKKRAKASATKTATPDVPTPAKKSAPPSILTLSADTEVETQESRENTICMSCRTPTVPGRS